MIRRILAALFGTTARPGRGVPFIAIDPPRPTSRTDEDDGPAPLVVADRPRPGPRDLARALLHRHELPDATTAPGLSTPRPGRRSVLS